MLNQEEQRAFETQPLVYPQPPPQFLPPPPLNISNCEDLEDMNSHF